MRKPADMNLIFHDMNLIFHDMNLIFLTFVPVMPKKSALFPIMNSYYEFLLAISMRVERWDKPNLRLMFNQKGRDY